MWPDPDNHIPALEIIAKPAAAIAKLANIEVPEDCGYLIVEETGAGPDHPFSGEKLSSVLALYKYSGEIDNAVDWINAITITRGRVIPVVSIQTLRKTSWRSR